MKSKKTQFAGLWVRTVALAVDVLLFCVVFFPATKAIKGVWIMGRSDHLWGYGWLVTDPLCIIFLVIMGVYFIALEGTIGATVGKWVCGLRVVGTSNTKTTLLKSLVRNLLRTVDALPAFSILGIILILSSPERARAGDRVAGTRVVLARHQKTTLT